MCKCQTSNTGKLEIGIRNCKYEISIKIFEEKCVLLAYKVFNSQLVQLAYGFVYRGTF